MEESMHTAEADADNSPRNDGRNNLDRRTLIVSLACLNMALQMIIHKVRVSQQVSLLTMTTIIHLLNNGHGFLRHRSRSSPRSVWRLERETPYVDQTLMGSHSDKEFKRRCRVSKTTFLYICSVVAPDMQKSKRGGGIPLEKRVTLCLNRLGTGNYLLACADLVGMSEGLASVVVRQFCASVMKHIRPIVVPRWTPAALKKLAAQFEAKHGLPYIMGAIDGSHIPIIAPKGDATLFYNRKGFHSALLQGVVDIETIFWDWDFGWAGSLHDYTLFGMSFIGRKTERGDFRPYKLIGDAAYPTRICMYVPFKGSKEQLEPWKAHWNFIQSSTRMCVERAFGVLKGRWRILLRRLEMRLDHVSDVVGACICLHNLCVMHKDFADDHLLQEAKTWLQQQRIASFGDLKLAGTMKMYDYANTEVQRLDVDLDEFVRRAGCPDDVEYGDSDVVTIETSTVKALKDGVLMHVTLAKQLFSRHLAEDVQLPAGLFEEDSSESSEA